MFSHRSQRIDHTLAKWGAAILRGTKLFAFILWRATTSELWTPVLFPLYCFHLFTLLTASLREGPFFYFYVESPPSIFMHHLREHSCHSEYNVHCPKVLID
jgi:hypothetical protein